MGNSLVIHKKWLFLSSTISLIDIFVIRMAISDVPKNEGETNKKAEAGRTMPAKGAVAR